MGRQLPLMATPHDERELLRFIESIAPIRLFVSFADTVESLWCDDWEHVDIPDTGFNVWLTNFSWTPEYKQTGGPKCPASRRGYWYVSNSSTAPILEVSRPMSQTYPGRIYWARTFCAPTGLSYDEASFNCVVDRTWRWIRKHAVRHVLNAGDYEAYFLPQAWDQHNA